MKFIVCAASLVVLLWGTPALAGPCLDDEPDGVCDVEDNCIEPTPNTVSGAANPSQTDTDGDDCGNVCDPDVDNDGLVGFGDFFPIIGSFLLPVPLHKLTEPPGGVVGFGDFFTMIDYFLLVPGPSGTTSGTVACPL